jgi:hypothetical protein
MCTEGERKDKEKSNHVPGKPVITEDSLPWWGTRHPRVILIYGRQDSKHHRGRIDDDFMYLLLRFPFVESLVLCLFVFGYEILGSVCQTKKWFDFKISKFMKIRPDNRE